MQGEESASVSTQASSTKQSGPDQSTTNPPKQAAWPTSTAAFAEMGATVRDRIAVARAVAGTEIPAPRQRRLAGVSAWALVLAVCGIIVGLAALITDLSGAGGWFEPTIVVVGLIGVGVTAGGLGTVRRRVVPFALLGVATFVLLVGTIITLAA